MKLAKCLIMFMAGVMPPTMCAGQMGPMDASLWSYLVAVDVGPVWGRMGKTQTLFLTPAIEKTYTANQSTNTLLDGALFLGIDHLFSSRLEGQFGFEFSTASKATLSGNIWDDADPAFNNFNYHYQVNHFYVGLKGKVIKHFDALVQPYLSVSLGIGFNEAKGFNSTPLIFEAIPQANFTSHTTTSFSYVVGVGVQRTLNSHWQVGVGYEFADWGSSQLGRALGQTLGKGLVNNQLYTNGLMFNVTYVT